MAKWISYENLKYTMGKVKALLNGKVDKIEGKGLSENDYTTAEKTKLAGIAEGANKYVHPLHTAKAAGLYKVTIDAEGHVSTVNAVTKADITALGIPAQDTDTTYAPATSSANGLMSSADKAKLDAFGAASTYAKASALAEYAKKTDITNVYKYKGTVTDVSKLPSANTAGDVYDIQAESAYGPAGTNVAWNGKAWDALGGKFAITEASTAEIDSIFSAL